MQTGQNDPRKRTAGGIILTILLTGAAWGIFEATVGYLLHLLPVKVGWLVWYPAACAFMAAAYRRTGKSSAILYVAVLSAGIKLLNLLLPVRTDMVINPAVSILLEALTMFCAAVLLARLGEGAQARPLPLALAVLGMNCAWRGLYLLYLLWLVPPWIRELSVLNNLPQLPRFLILENLVTSAILFAAFWLVQLLWRKNAQPARDGRNSRVPAFFRPFPVKIAAAVLLLCASALLQMFL